MRFPPLPELNLRPARPPAPTRAGLRRPFVAGSRARSATGTRHEDLWRRALETMARRFADPDLTLEGVAAEIGISARELQLIFAEHGQCFRDSLRSIRMARAGRLVLLKTPADVAALRAGYRERRSFANAFAREHGVTPSVLRRAVIARERYEAGRENGPPESMRSLRKWEADMARNAALVRHVHGQIVEASAA